ncbi:IclR family transcriptional regulator [Alkalihalobacillus alcalophilus ATCC 27647 = CGMCC 1.3604]|uniref:Caunorubicin/doxorubicin resistance ATP-binding protein n=1 Tax=Alkalihalobacillus alcalophilus ATCC 27647 = CGMCC 1.3604 TaxID=1218173 RepID=A0A094XEV4_ALKAL|nr:daunorubicin resistance protein DrrA family ABC transporter ATP-binding protein [Alkalihalobacillus alcalophilus]KGA97280.1 caunorubicin/doxorubicin resistance ATP-binding protein [Alkalihalobacillus alcalophilus ATCC 27647 = CGMCC 1.3604]MED1562804.1 daunorubicin resistance protein DrrA family ABC transporter ATP-binding protein [Alkalihalobacillus alcalophilus]THG91513.1 IclR family transcriptional regulator [Alkalihalobacillus alcalophilus ATCC 27647 = CGMCC 1.3604]
MKISVKKKRQLDLAVETKGLVKVFGDHTAVDGVDLKIEKGTVYGFLGPNGAGKTTTIRMLATLLKPDAGYARIFGHDLETETKEVRKRISLTGQYASIDEDLTGLENLIMIAKLSGFKSKEAKARALELLSAFQLEEATKKQVKKYSGGMRRRIDIAASIVVTPDLLFLDEPTTGLDPRSRNQVWDIVRALTSVGTTVLLTTQYLEEADKLADRIAVIDKGKIIAEGTSQELKASVGKGTLSVTISNPEDSESVLNILTRYLDSQIKISEERTVLIAQVNDPSRVAEAMGELVRSNIELLDFSLGQPSLDEVFLTLTNESAGRYKQKEGATT